MTGMRVKLLLTLWCVVLGVLIAALDLTRWQAVGLVLFNSVACVWLEDRHERGV